MQTSKIHFAIFKEINTGLCTRICIYICNEDMLAWINSKITKHKINSKTVRNKKIILGIIQNFWNRRYRYVIYNLQYNNLYNTSACFLTEKGNVSDLNYWFVCKANLNFKWYLKTVLLYIYLFKRWNCCK